METSLIGKALDFGSSDYGFESHVSNLSLYSPVYVLNHVKINSAKKQLVFKIKYTKKIFIFLNFLKNMGLLRKVLLINNNKKKNSFVLVYIFYFKNLSVYKTFKIISTPAVNFFISYNSLRLLNKRTRNSIFILETSKGVMAHFNALKFKIGGRVLGFFSI